MSDYQGAVYSTGDDDSYEYTYRRRNWNRRNGRPETEGLYDADLTADELAARQARPTLIEAFNAGRPVEPDDDDETFTGILSGGFDELAAQAGVGQILADQMDLEASGRPADEAATTWVDARLAPRPLSDDELARRNPVSADEAAAAEAMARHNAAVRMAIAQRTAAAESALARQAARRLIAVTLTADEILGFLTGQRPDTMFLLPPDTKLFGVFGDVGKGPENAHVTLVVESDRFAPIGAALNIPKFILPDDANALFHLSFGR